MAPPPGVFPSTVRPPGGSMDPLFASAAWWSGLPGLPPPPLLPPSSSAPGRSEVSLGAQPYAKDRMNSETSDCGVDCSPPGGLLNYLQHGLTSFPAPWPPALSAASGSQHDASSTPSGSQHAAPQIIIDDVQDVRQAKRLPYTEDQSDDSMDPADIYTLEEFAAEQNVLDSFARCIKEKMKAKSEAGPSRRRSGPRMFINRNREGAHEQLVADYFAAEPLYSDAMFRRRFRMRRHVFLRIVSALGVWSPYFNQRVDCTNRLGLSPLQKCTAAIRMLAYGTSADTLDEYLKVAESTAMECMEKFVEGVIATFGKEYLRHPTCEELEQLLHVGESRGFPGMLGSIDCMHWQWEKCPTAWKGQYTRGDYRKPTVILEAVASHDLRIWHGFFGMAGSNNDINVLNQSPLFHEVLKGKAPNVQFSVNGNEYNTGYYLADGIYPEWAAFVKTISSPLTEKHKLYAMHQEGARKDIERAFGVLQARFNIVRRPARLWSAKIIDSIMYACIILHNMIVEDEGKKAEENIDLNHAPSTSIVLPPEANVGTNDNPCFDDVRRRNAAIRARPIHTQLKKDLVEHIWHRFGNRHNN